jgi:hypothetical protein
MMKRRIRKRERKKTKSDSVFLIIKNVDFAAISTSYSVLAYFRKLIRLLERNQAAFPNDSSRAKGRKGQEGR